MENNGSSKIDSEMRPNGRNEGLTVVVVVVDKSSKLPLFYGSGNFEERNNQVGENRVEIIKVVEGPPRNVINDEGFYEER